MILFVDLITTLDKDLRQLPPTLGRAMFLGAFRGTRMLAHTPEGAWDAYREGRLLPTEAKLVARTLEEYLAPLPEYGRLVCLSFAHTGAPPALKTMTLTAQTLQEEQGVLEGFWQALSREVHKDYQLVTYGGSRWGNAFLLRRTLLRGLAPSGALPTSRVSLDVHFDLSEILSNGDRTRVRPLELAAIEYGLPGPWADPADEAGADTAPAIRTAVTRGELGRARALAEARLHALWGLHQRLVIPYIAATG